MKSAGYLTEERQLRLAERVWLSFGEWPTWALQRTRAQLREELQSKHKLNTPKLIEGLELVLESIEAIIASREE